MRQSEILEGLRQLGLHEGDVLLLHSSLSSLGWVDGGARAVVSAFLEALGAQGTLVVPAFGSLGAIAEVVKTDPRVVHSLHPLASVAAIGQAAETICRDHWKAKTAFGEDTPYSRIADLNGYVCLLGVDQDRNTTLHTVETMLQLPYLRENTVTFATPEGEITKTWPCSPGPHRDFIGLDQWLRERGILQISRIGNAWVRLMKSKDLISACLAVGRVNPTFVLCNNPNCADCTKQHADTRQNRLKQEPFTLGAASGLAGRYVPEMIENLGTCGLHHIELDFVERKPVYLLPENRLGAVVEELKHNDIKVTAIRCNAVIEKIKELMIMATGSQVERIILPLSSEAKAHLQIAAELGLKLSFFNSHQCSQHVSEMLLALKIDNFEVRFDFSAANFARAGERPFLDSYKKKLRRFVDQLDLEDCSFDGSNQPLAEGNAEIKEMISILRCSSFSGPMVLTSANRQFGNLSDGLTRFEMLLDKM